MKMMLKLNVQREDWRSEWWGWYSTVGGKGNLESDLSPARF